MHGLHQCIGTSLAQERDISRAERDDPTRTDLMHIRLVSSLTAEDETRIATAICNVVSCLLDQFGIAYTLRIETADGQTFEETACAEARVPARDVLAT